jgi:sugar lactone lactonase YvrE
MKTTPWKRFTCVAFLMAAPMVLADVLYVPSGTGNVIKRIGSSGIATDQAVVADAGAVVFSDDGAAYATDVADGKIVKISVNGTISDFATGLTSPTGLAIDSNGILFAAVGTGVAGESKILKFDQGAGNGTLFVNLPSNSNPQGLAFSSAGNLYVAQKGLNRISEITPAGAISVFSATSGQASSQVTAPVALAFDPAGTLFATDSQSGGRLASLAGGAGKAKTVEIGLGADLRGLCFDAAGAAYVAVGDAGTIKKIVVGNPDNTVAHYSSD